MKKLLALILLIGISIPTNAQNLNEKLYEAVVKNDLKKTEKLINKGADVKYLGHYL
ncbi:hypothetical protein [Winogradskyella thalassocola]|uniref:Ankyrin repeat-containing protein n=1 Tax=Winogradskyella thalassocola TaxID=262004 RepID=A0A1G8J882_9FLAO|nr:hypothetical protein [Winogradskyella thalassocola]SDI27459.1 hypothetical protein SAMN04489796_1096 [Winogradskyella thalassocola]